MEFESKNDLLMLLRLERQRYLGCAATKDELQSEAVDHQNLTSATNGNHEESPVNETSQEG